jgi:integrase/recombinase XerC
MTFNKYLQEFTSYLQEHDRSQATIKGYNYDLQQFGRWFEQTNGQQPILEAITPVDVKEYRSHMQTMKGFKPATVNRHLRALRAFCRWAVEMGHIATDPTVNIKGVKQQRLDPKTLDRTEIYRMMRILEERLQSALNYKGALSKNAAKAKRDMAMVMLLLHTGLRVSELAGLELSDVEMSGQKGSLTLASKGDKQRKVPLNAEARKALRQWLEVRPNVESKALFLGRGDVPLGVRGVQRVLANLGERAQIKNLYSYTLRHTFATRYLKANPGDLIGLAAILGHESLEALRIYTVPHSAKLSSKVEMLTLRDK